MDGLGTAWDGGGRGAAAVVGMACRLPGAADWPAFGELLMSGRAAIREVPPERWDWRRHHGTRGPDGGDPLPPHASASRWGGFLDAPPDCFDHAYFGLSPKEARLMDPQQRLLLEEVVHCLEDAGIAPEALRVPHSRTSVHVGVMAQDHLQALGAFGVPPDGHASLGGSAALLANRVSHLLGLSGESVTVDAACASGLVALHQARRALAGGECDAAIVAAVSLLLLPWRHIAFSQARMLSPQGRCATFDRAADGYVPGEGAVVLLLRRPEDAHRDGQRIHGVVLGSATGHVGATRTITAPSVAAQRAVIEGAARSAGVGLESISYVEAHGTGTALGDPIEVEALTQGFTAAGAAPSSCRVGSAKTNIGHLEPVAGLVGVLKLLIMLRERRLAPTLNLDHPNPLIDFEGGPFRPVVEAGSWLPAPGTGRLRAGVSAFGFGGAVAHSILEEAPPDQASAPPSPQLRPAWPILLSAHSRTAFTALWEAWRRNAAEDGGLPPLSDIAATLARGRTPLRWRAALMAADPAGLRAALAAPPEPRLAKRLPRLALRFGPGDAVAPGATAALAVLAPRCVAAGAGGRRLAMAQLLLDALAPLVPLRIEAVGEAMAEARALAGAEDAPAGARAPLLDLSTGELRPGRRITAAYLATLRHALVEADAAEAGLLLARAASLAADNATFAGYVADWQRAIGARGSLRGWLARPAAPGATERRLAILAAVTALRRLHEKWQLPERHQALGPAWFEAAALIVSGVLPEAEALAWLEAEPKALGPVAAAADARRPQLPHDAAVPLLDAMPPQPESVAASAEAEPEVTVVFGAAEGLEPTPPGLVLALDPARPATTLLEILARLWEHGAPVNWALLPGRVANAPLPLYPFDAHRHALEMPALPPAAGTTALAAEHVIGGRALVPAAAMALALAEGTATGKGPCTLDAVEFHRPVEAVEAALLTQAREGAGSVSLKLDGAAVVAAADISSDPPPTACALPVAEAGLDDPGLVPASLYARLARMQHGYGPALRVIAAAREVEGILACDLATTLPEAALDGALQACLVAALHWGHAGGASSPLMPAAIRRLWLRHGSAAHAVGQAAGLRALVRRDALRQEVRGFTASVTVHDAGGEPWAVAEGVRFLPAATGPEDAPAEVPLRVLSWHGAAASGPAPRGALVLGNPEGLGRRVAALLPASYLVPDGDAKVQPATATDIFVLWGLEAPATPDTAAADAFLRRAVAPLRALLRSLAAPGGPDRHLRIVTRGRHAVLPAERVAAPLAAMLAALGKSAAREAGPALRVTTLDLPEQPSEADLAALAAAPGVEGLEEAAIRCGGVFVPRLAPAPPLANGQAGGTKGGVQVIAGGAGGLGRLVAEHLARTEGARIALLSRRAAPPGMEALLAALRQAGAPDAIYLPVDITDAAALDAALERLREIWGPIAGVVQAAMVLSDLRLAEMDEAGFARALAPKLAGTLNLFAATRADRPGRFVLFSSALTLRGNPGQANYLAGCAAQEGFAEWASCQRIPAQAIQWGLWREAGRVASRIQAERVTRANGLLPFASGPGLAAFGAALGRPEPRLVAAALDARWTGALGEAADPWHGLAARLGLAAEPEEAALDSWADRHAATRLAGVLAAARLLPIVAGEDEASWRRRVAAPLPRLTSPLTAALELLSRHGLVRRGPGGELSASPSAAAGPEGMPVPDAARGWAAAAEACIAGWPALLAGRATGGELLAPAGDAACLERLHHGLPGARRALARFAQLAADAAAVLAARSSPVRVLQIQAGSGETTLPLAEALGACGAPTALTAADRSGAMLDSVRRRLAARHPGVRLLRLDPFGRQPAAAPAGEEAHDLILGLGAALPEPEVLLPLLRARLRPGGLMLLRVPTGMPDREVATLGLHEDAWRKRPDAAAWRGLLAASGFDRIALADEAGGLLVLARHGTGHAKAEAPATAAPVADPAEPSPPARPTLPSAPLPMPEPPPRPAVPDLLPAVIEAVAEAIELPSAEVDPATRFLEMGVDSIVAAAVADRLRQRLGRRLSPHLFGDHPTPEALARHLQGVGAEQAAAVPAPATHALATEAPVPAAAVGAAKPSPGTAHGVGAALRDAIAEAIGLSATDIEDDAPFGALGLDSVAAMEVAERLAARTGRRVPLHLFGDHPTPAALARHLDGRDAAPAASPISPAVAFAPATTAPAPSALPRPGAAAGDAIAITGMAGRFPGAPDLSTFWSLLLEGRSALGPVPEGRWAEAEFAGLAPGLDPARLGCGGFLADAESFDAAFFGLSPREAMAMDPQQRLLLEETWNALADAGLAAAPAEARQRTGVWVGAGTGDWPLKLALSGQAPDRVSLVGQLGGSLASRVAHAFGLQGPAVTLDTACASAVAALAAAAAALRRGEVDIAVAAAVAVMATPQLPALAEAAGLLSASGRCAALTPAADGMLLGEGVGVLVLRRLEDALAAGETTHAVLSAARMGHDGGGSLGISTPSAAGQARLARRVLAASGTVPEAINWLEAHGVGTAAGDATELAAAGEVLGRPGAASGPLPLGSVKPAIGHGLAASGMAGLMKVALQLRHRRLLPTAGLSGGPPLPELAAAGLEAPAETRPWAAAPDGAPRRALISVFALNGANGMVVVEEPPPLPAGPPAAAGARLLLLTAQSETALRRRAADLAAWLQRHPDLALPDLARTLAEGAAPLAWRAALLAEDIAGATALLEAVAAGRERPGAIRLGRAQRRDPGAESLLAGMAAGLLAQASQGGDTAPLLAAAELLVSGVPAALPVDRTARRLTLLPGYPFARERFWPGEAPIAAAAASSAPGRVIEGRPASGTGPVERLRALLSAVLRLPAERIPEEASPLSLGLDSLLALELRHRIARELGADPPVQALLAAPDLPSLVAAVAEAPAARDVPAVIQPDPAARHEPFPLTEIQLAYLAGRSAGMPLSGPCHGYWEFEAASPWDRARLERALNSLIAAHDMLRAEFGAAGMQRVLPEVPPYRIAWHDWRGRADGAQRLAGLREGFAGLRFDPSRWPLFRVEVSQDDDVARLHLAVDLLIIDVPSLFRLLGQWAALLRDPAAEALPPPLTFRDCVLGARAREDDAASRRAAEFWREEAARLPPGPDLPDRKALEPGAEWRAGRHLARLAPAEWSAFRAFATAAGLTPANAVLTAFAEVLAHWATAPRFTLNLTVMEREAAHPAIAEVLGDFTSTLLLGLDLSAPMPFAERARVAVRDRLGTLLTHARHGGVRVLRELARSGGARPMMPVVFTSMLGYGRPQVASGPWGLSALGRLSHGITRTPQVWLDCHVHEDAEGALVACWDAVDQLFPDALIAGMFAAFSAALHRLAAEDAAWGASLGAWIAAREQAPRRARNAAAPVPAPEGLLHEPFLRHALARPDRPAVIAPDRSLTHGELLGHALAVAAALREARPDELIAVAMPRGWEQVASVLGVLLAGGAYLPVDSALPPERLRGIIARGEARTILTTAATEAALATAWPEGIARIAVDRLRPLALPAAPPPRPATPDDLAYVIFTSGSTGEPKGVMVEHRAALNTVLDINEQFGIGPADRTLALSALSFDLSVWDIFGVLGAGGAVVVPAQRSVADPAHLAGLVERHGVTVWNSVPMFLQLLLEGAPPPAALASLRMVMLSGDWIPLSLPPRFRALNDRAELVSLGGATEASIWSILHRIGEKPEPGWASVPYGAAMRGQSVVVLDEAMEECPDFVPGELYIGGTGLARGYWRDPARTAKRFVIHPRSGERLYRTGDLGRWREEGLIEFLGRRDGQVKLGGHRVELGEVEAALARHPGVAQAVAVAPVDARGGRRLVAFCVATGTDVRAEAIRTTAARLLPAYMVPAELRLVPALPRSANDKVDRRALEALAGQAGPSGNGTAREALPPRRDSNGALEERLLGIWRAALGDPALTAEANLFEHGAHSLAAVQATARIAREVGPCSVTDLFEFPSVAALARRMSEAPGGSPHAEPLRAPADPIAARAERRRAARTMALGAEPA